MCTSECLSSSFTYFGHGVFSEHHRQLKVTGPGATRESPVSASCLSVGVLKLQIEPDCFWLYIVYGIPTLTSNFGGKFFVQWTVSQPFVCLGVSVSSCACVCVWRPQVSWVSSLLTYFFREGLTEPRAHSLIDDAVWSVASGTFLVSISQSCIAAPRIYVGSWEPELWALWKNLLAIWAISSASFCCRF